MQDEKFDQKNFSVSVIIPVYNTEKYLEQAVESALLQSEVNEVILVEDGSTDNSIIVCNDMIRGDSRLKLFRHPNGENRGAGATRNLGIRMATQDFIAFLDADDYFLPNRFESTKNIFQRFPDTDGVYECIGTDFFSTQAKKDYRKTKRPKLTTVSTPDISPQDLFEALVLTKYGYFSLDGFTMKKSAIEPSLFFDEKLRIAEDTDFLLRIAKKKFLRPGNLLEPVSMRGVHGGNITMVTKNVLFSKDNFYRKWFFMTKDNNWPKSVNRQFLMQHSLASARIYTTGIAQWPLSIINLVRNLLTHSWILRKII